MMGDNPYEQMKVGTNYAQALSTRRMWCIGERGRRPGVRREKGRKAMQRGRTTFIRQKQLLLTGGLLTALLLLLFGICSQLPAPDLNPPRGTAVIDSSWPIARTSTTVVNSFLTGMENRCNCITPMSITSGQGSSTSSRCLSNGNRVLRQRNQDAISEL